MHYAIISSKTTGNTGMLTEKVHQALKGFSTSKCIFCDSVDNITAEALTADRLYIGFWTDQGQCDKSTQALLTQLKNKEIFLFGSAGFGMTQAYFDDVLSKTKEYIDDTNKIIGEFMCQGKMKPVVREKYEAMLKKAEDSNDEKTVKTAKMLIENFDLAKSHPDMDDLMKLSDKVAKKFY